MLKTSITPFHTQLHSPLTKQKIETLQINLGKICNLVCNHCHVEAGPKRTEQLSPEVCQQLIELIQQFPPIKTVDLTGGAPEMNYGFKPLVEAATAVHKQVIVRSNLTIYFQPGFADLPDYFVKHKIRVVASLPCYLENNVDQMRGKGVYNDSIKALQWLNQLGYGSNPELILDLVYNPPIPTTEEFSLTPQQQNLEKAYKAYLQEQFNIVFNHLFTITNLPIGRTKFHLRHRQLEQPYLQFLATHFNPQTLDQLMCRNHLSIDYRGYVYDCDFNQMEDLPAKNRAGEVITVSHILAKNSLDIIEEIQTDDYCYGCTAGCGSSCGGALTVES